MRTDTVASGYAHMIDNSTPASLAQTLTSAADHARADAAKLDDRAAELRTEAAGLDDMPGMREAAEELRAEATKVADDAEQRRGMAGGFESRAAEVASEAS